MAFVSDKFLAAWRPHYRPLAAAAKSWAFDEAKKLVARYENKKPITGAVVFETGYGPSGLPHIGTFGEVLRTTMVRQAFAILSDIPTKLICFSDDMDGFRKVPTNVPNQEMLQKYLGIPLTRVPNPFTDGAYAKYKSYGEQNNARLRDFLDQFWFDYEFMSSTEQYTSGFFDAQLKKYLKHHDDILAVMLPTLGAERQSTYSPFLPIHPETGVVLQVPVIKTNVDKNTITYLHDGKEIEQSILGGQCKLQWKPDWSMRMQALNIDYEMAGKDLIPSAELALDIIGKTGGTPPLVFHYELFLDDKGQKISKSKGNGLTMEEWLRYAPKESLAYFMYQKPKTAKRLFFDIIPKNVDEYYQQLNALHKQSGEKKYGEMLDNTVFHISPEHWQDSLAPAVSFSLLLHLVSASDASDKKILWGFINNYYKDVDAAKDKALDALVGFAIRYYEDFVKPHKKFKKPNETEKQWLVDLSADLQATDATTPEDLQTIIYERGKKTTLELRAWFQLLYETLLGQVEGPRLGSFITLFGREKFIGLIDAAVE
ncbi:MAG: lysine--tRNA ligase [Hydrotalea sp.]|nr:lysine--tRNA ligase [Hydrotalea sp.]